MDERTKKIATIALHLAMKGDFEEAANYVNRLSGGDGLLWAILRWIDTFMAGVYPEHKPGDPLAVRFFAIETEELASADDVGWAKAWAGRLISYRATEDIDGFNAVLHSVPQGRGLGDGVMALLNIVGSSLANVERTRQAAAKVGAEINRGAS